MRSQHTGSIRLDTTRPAPSYDGPPARMPVWDAALVDARNPYGTERVAKLIAEVDRRDLRDKAGRPAAERTDCDMCGTPLDPAGRSARWCPACVRTRKAMHDRRRYETNMQRRRAGR